ncbi:MAG: translation initiation factor IF-3 [Gammaproteobacteria bacterium]|nr:translation initiation factor IF-3 [Gammaproteobacteria bacterium]MDE1887405.1 translation initiation factor IF-3 [Gammaproteobacteria bacterium]MDE2022789.1 translation initiation factor IF-3 [Gammaproteobacteria bacterium]MDE2274462.1 translation initiation factor IF-3 [Gammaproteobacteria bacterium]
MEDRLISSEKRARRNGEITSPKVRVIGPDNQQIGIMFTREAVQYAEQAGLDLVEVSPTAEPPVCRVMDFGKYLFELNKKQQSARKKQKQIQVKEVKFRPTTDEGDYRIKLRNLTRFLAEGDKTKVTIRFRGREMLHQELGTGLIERIRGDLTEAAQVEQYPRLEGRQLVMVLSPKKK